MTSATVMGKPLLRKASRGDASGLPGPLCLRACDKLGPTAKITKKKDERRKVIHTCNYTEWMSQK
jgi:hypothetical protein